MISLTVVWLSYIVIHIIARVQNNNNTIPILNTFPIPTPSSVMNYQNMDDEEDQKSNEWIFGCGIVVMGLVLIVTAGVISVVIYGKFKSP